MLPVIDIFAGPGGLGEGFSQVGFDVRLSVEMDSVACQTLTLRKFFHQFKAGQAPKEYYSFLRGEISLSTLQQSYHDAWHKAEQAVANLEMGTLEGNEELYKRLENKISPDEEFILVGGPPCQAYSLAGRSRMLGVGKDNQKYSLKERNDLDEKLATEFYSDKRHTLYKEYVKILSKYQPAIFVMENVKGLSSAKTDKDAQPGSVFQNICHGLRRGISENGLARNGHPVKGYRLYSLSSSTEELSLFQEITQAKQCLLKSEEYGVPQARHRIIIVGVREDLNIKPKPISPSVKKYTVADAIYDLPKLRSGLSKQQDSNENWSAAIIDQVENHLLGKTSFDEQLSTEFYKFKQRNISLNRGEAFIPAQNKNERSKTNDLLNSLYDDKLGGYIQHATRSHMKSDLLRYFFVSTYGQTFGRSPKLADWEGTLQKLRPNHSNIENNGQSLATKSHTDRFKVQIAEKQSSTVVSHISKDGHYFIHPDPGQCRSLTVREAARLQTFPDNYFFCGNRTQQYHQVGNAVPVRLSNLIAQTIKNALKRHE